MRAKHFPLEQLFYYPSCKTRLQGKDKSSWTTFWTLSPPPYSFLFKCILSAVPGHLENINNHLRSQMPSHWEFPNWVTLQSAAQNHTQSRRAPHSATDTHTDTTVSNGEVCGFRKYLFCLPSNSPFAGIFSLILKDMWLASVCEELFVEV